MRRTVPILLTLLFLGGVAALATTVTPENLPRALEAQRGLVADNPGDGAAHNDLGNLLVLAGRYAEAEDAYRRAVEVDPEAASFHYNLALLLQQRGSLKDATRHLRRVVELEPGHAWAHFQLGVVLELRGRSRDAIAEYGVALQLEPGLAFPDVNPSVIESDLLTEAMLRGYRRGLVQPQAPRQYEDPGRITSLLLQSAGDEGLGEGAAEGSTEGAGAPAMEPAGQAAGAAGEADSGPPSEAGSRRRLNEGDLGEGPVNQATPLQGSGYRPPARPVTRFRPNQGGDDSTRTQRPARPSGGAASQGRPVGVVGVPGQVPRGAESSQGAQPDQPGSGRDLTQPDPRSRRTPRGVGSTGHLDTRLVPLETLAT